MDYRLNKQNKAPQKGQRSDKLSGKQRMKESRHIGGSHHNLAGSGKK